MSDALSGNRLYDHVRTISSVIGPRPAGSRAEMLTRQYIRQALKDIHVQQTPFENTFRTPKSTGHVLGTAVGLALAANLIGRKFRWIGAALTLVSLYSASQFAGGRRQFMPQPGLSTESANLFVRTSPREKVKQRVVLFAHTDSSKNRLMFRPMFKSSVRVLMTANLSLMAASFVGQLFGWRWLQKFALIGTGAALPLIAIDGLDDYVDGANNNASGIACLLGIAEAISEQPLEQTEVWLVFVGAGEAGTSGIQAFIDEHREELANAWFINFQMVGAGDTAYITRHGGLSAFSPYRPDDESLALAVETARKNPQLSVRGLPMNILDGLGTVRSRGFRGIGLVGVGHDGWPVNWHQTSDNIRSINPRSLERAARFAWAMLQNLDARS